MPSEAEFQAEKAKPVALSGAASSAGRRARLGIGDLEVRGEPDLRRARHHLEAFRTGPLGHVEFPYVFLDATYVKARVGGRVLARAVVVATGVTRARVNATKSRPSTGLLQIRHDAPSRVNRNRG